MPKNILYVSLTHHYNKMAAIDSLENEDGSSYIKAPCYIDKSLDYFRGSRKRILWYFLVLAEANDVFLTLFRMSVSVKCVFLVLLKTTIIVSFVFIDISCNFL